MKGPSQELHIQKMLSIIYEMPMGLIETDLEGNIREMNAKSIQLLMPHFCKNLLNGTSLHQLLEIIAPDLLKEIQQFNEQSGTIINKKRQELLFGNDLNNTKKQQYIFTVNKLDEFTLLYFFDDISELYNKEKQLSQMIQEKAIEQSKFEMASGVLHDIGNAVVGFGSYITKIKRTFERNNLGTLENLKSFIEKNQLPISNALGTVKANAMVDLLEGVLSNEQIQLTDIKQTIFEQQKIIGHVQEILTIQRQFVIGQSTERIHVNLRNLINDSVSMLLGTLDKKEIHFSIHAPAIISKIKGDSTRLMQVFLNLLKNAVDAFIGLESKNKEIVISVVEDAHKIVIEIKDNGKGFDSVTAANLFTSGYTTKTEGTGLGLANCKNIIETHNGEIYVTSEGVDKGASSIIIFNLSTGL